MKRGIFTALIMIVFFFASYSISTAIPSFARKYKTSCVTCHYAYPKLNAFGKAFKNNGYRYPQGQDPEMTKEEPVKLGVESYKRVWPDAIWPSDIAGNLPFSAHAIGRIHYGGNFDDPTTATVEEDKLLTFEIPHEFEILCGGTFGDNISYIGEMEWEHESEFAYEFAVQYDFEPELHMKFGSVGIHASPEHLRMTREHYNVVELQSQSGKFRLREGAGAGVEIWGAGNGFGDGGGFTYALGIGNGQNDGDNFDLNNEKDIYGRATLKFGGLSEIGGTVGQEGANSAFYEDNSLRVGGFFHKGTALVDTLNDKYTIMGGDIDWWFDRLNVVVMVMTMNSDFGGKERKSLAYFAEGNYVVYPWLITHARYEVTDKDTDDDTKDPTSSLIPAIIFMVRANVKCSIEYLVPLDKASKDANKGRFTFQFNFAF